MKIPFKIFIEKCRNVRPGDLGAVFQFALALPISWGHRHFRRNLWLICEEPYEARDNAYCFFKYLRREHPEQDVVYAIKKKSPDYKKVVQIGNTVEYGSLLHWIFYLTAARNISSQKGGKPNAALCYFLEVNEILKNKRVFLQHGVIINDLKWLYYSESKIPLFCCGSKIECEYIQKNFGYPKRNVKYLGLCRFDEWHHTRFDKRKILIIPTWRNWLVINSKKSKASRGTVDFEQYFNEWNHVIKSRELKEIAKEYNVEFLFYPHRNMQRFSDKFDQGSSAVTMLSAENSDLQKLLKECALLITDYSSVFFDFVYMKKPVIFYQFDIREFREVQYGKGYFDYGNNAFGNACYSLTDLILEIRRIFDRDFKPSEEFLNCHREHFPMYDNKNCERTYKAIVEME